jgi:hypothetical protein
MASSSPKDILDSARCVIRASRRRFDKYTEDSYGTCLVNDVIKYASGDHEKVELLWTFVGKAEVWIVFDYNNPQNLPIRVAGFKHGRSIKRINIPAKEVHSRVSRMMEENKQRGLSFPCLEAVSFNTADCLLSLKTECISTSVIYPAVLRPTPFEEETQQ